MGIWSIDTDDGSDGPRAQSIGMNGGDNCVCIRGVLLSAGNGCMLICPKLGLKAEIQRWSHGSGRTHVECMKNLVEVQLPGSDRLFVVLRVETPGDHTSLTPTLGDVLLDLRHSPVIERLVSKSHDVVSLVQLASLIAQSP